jgi:hypothetical protein
LGYEKIQNTVWEKVDENKAELDIDEIEEYFAMKIQPKKVD